MATQYFKRNLLLNLCREGKYIYIYRQFVSSCCLRDKNVCHLQPISSIWRPLAFLPVTLSIIGIVIYLSNRKVYKFSLMNNTEQHRPLSFVKGQVERIDILIRQLAIHSSSTQYLLVIFLNQAKWSESWVLWPLCCSPHPKGVITDLYFNTITLTSIENCCNTQSIQPLFFHL